MAHLNEETLTILKKVMELQAFRGGRLPIRDKGVNQIFADVAKLIKENTPTRILIEQSEGLIQSIWTNHPGVEVVTFYNEDDPPEDPEDLEEWTEQLQAMKAEIEDGKYTDILNS
jgi:hypothetical protein